MTEDPAIYETVAPEPRPLVPEQSGLLEAIRENTSSIELTRSPKGEYSWKVKCYFDGDGPADHAIKLALLYEIDQQLRAQYLGSHEAAL